MRCEYRIKAFGTQCSRQCIQRLVTIEHTAFLIPDVHAGQKRMAVEQGFIALAHADVNRIVRMRSMPCLPQRRSQDGVSDEGRLDEQYFPRGHGAKIRVCRSQPDGLRRTLRHGPMDWH